MLQEIYIDLMEMTSVSARGFKYVITIIDSATGKGVFEPSKNKKADSILAALIMRWIYEYGCPIKIRSDKGSEFIDELNRLAYAIYGVQFQTGSAYSSQSQGIVERAIGTIRQVLLKHSEAEPENWDLSLLEVQFQYNTTTHGWRGLTPYELLFVRRVNYPLELTQELILKDVVDSGSSKA